MKRLVVDASVAVKWYVPEIHSEAAAKLLSGPYELIAPDLILPEAANVIWKKVARRELTEKEGNTVLAELLSAGIELVPSSRYIEAALIPRERRQHHRLRLPLSGGGGVDARAARHRGPEVPRLPAPRSSGPAPPLGRRPGVALGAGRSAGGDRTTGSGTAGSP